MKIPTKLIEPIIIENKWWEQYEELNSCDFTNDNSARSLRYPEIYWLSDDYKLLPVKYINDKYRILGFTLNPPFNPTINSDPNLLEIEYVAIMFENEETFEKVWFHFCK